MFLKDSETVVHNSQDVTRIIVSRRTIHKFKPQVPPRDIIFKSIEMASWAPNHKQTEPWRFYILGPETTASAARLNAEIVEKKKGAAVANAKLKQWQQVPLMIVVTCAKAGDPFREKEDYAATCCAIQNMSLYLWSEGVGVKWSTTKTTQTAEFHALLNIDKEKEEVVGLLWCGYPEEIPQKDRQPLEAIARELP